jgi:hypothetical protein
MLSASDPESVPAWRRHAPQWVGGLVLAGLIVLAPQLGMGFYAPARGQVATGEPRPGGREMPRDRAAVKVIPEMAAPGERPTLADVVRFYGLDEDAVRCTAAEAYGLAVGDKRIDGYARRAVKVGDTVTVCLD